MTRRKPTPQPAEPAGLEVSKATVIAAAMEALGRPTLDSRPIVLGPELVAQIREALAAADLIQQRYALGTATWGDVREYSGRLDHLLRAVLIADFSSYEPRWNEPDQGPETSVPSSDPEKQEPVP